MGIKYLTSSLCLVLMLTTIQHGYSQKEITVIDSTVNGTIKFAKVIMQSKSIVKEESKVFLKRVLNAGKGTDFYLYRVLTDELGMTHEKYQQTFNGIKVEFSEFIVHKGKSGSIVAINGDFAHVPESFNIKPKLLFEAALDKVMLERKTKYKVNNLLQEKSVEIPQTSRYDRYEIVIIKGNDNQLHLAYKANLEGGDTFGSFYGYTDCETGVMVYTNSLIYFTNTPGSASTIYSGNQTVTTDSYSGGYRLSESNRGGSTSIHTRNFNRLPYMHYVDCELVFYQTAMNIATEFSDQNNTWDEYNNLYKDNAALDAHFGAEKTFDYFKAVHSRNSYDDSSSTINLYVHVNDFDADDRNCGVFPKPMQNAFWDPTRKAFFFGDGVTLSPLVTLDIVAHEIGHAHTGSMVGNSEGLVYN
jgi:bacillolysin